MTKATFFQEENTTGYLNSPRLEGYIYEDVFQPVFFNNLKNTVMSLLEGKNKNTFLTHNTKFSFGDRTIKIVSHKQNAREQNVIYDLTFQKEWYYQTKDTIKYWATDTLTKTVSPIFLKVISTLETLPPFSEEKDNWIFYRLHLNYLSKGQNLTVHLDSSSYITDCTKEGLLDNNFARMRSITFYLYDHVPNLGGEFWTPNGFVYKPKQNTAISINGNKVLHGVTTNMDDTPRRAFTIRAVHKDDLLLPGHPDKFLYKVSDFYD